MINGIMVLVLAIVVLAYSRAVDHDRPERLSAGAAALGIETRGEPGLV